MIRLSFVNDEYDIAPDFVEVGPHPIAQVRLCVRTVQSYFKLPRGTKAIELVFTKDAHPDAYTMSIGPFVTIGKRRCYIDGSWKPSFMWEARTKFVRLVADGYKYVRCEYKT